MSNLAESFHQLTASTISQLSVLLQLKYQTQTGPFATLPTTMLVTVSSIVLYYLLQIGLLGSPTRRFAAVAAHFLVWLEYVAVATLAVPLFPDKATHIIYTIFGLISTGQVLYVFRDKLRLEDKLRNMCGRVTKFFGQQPPPTLPI